MIKEHDRQADFLQSLMLLCESEPAGELLGRIRKARHEDRVMRVAVLLSFLLGLVTLGTLGYASVLAPDSFFRGSTSLRLIQSVGMASFICAIGFLLHWYWKRTVFNALLQESRCFIMLQLQIQKRLGPRSEMEIVQIAESLTPPARRLATP